MSKKLIYLIIAIYFLSMGAVAKIIEVAPASARMTTMIVGGGSPAAVAGIALDSISEDGCHNDDCASLTLSHTTTGSNVVLFIFAGGQTMDAGEWDTPTYNGSSVGVTSMWDVSGTSTYNSSAWYLIAPATGTYDVVVTPTAATEHQIYAIAITYTGVHQTVPIGTPATWADYSEANEDPTVSPTAGGTDDLVISGIFIDDVDDVLTAIDSQVVVERISIAGERELAVGSKTGASGAVAMTWDKTGAGWNALGGVAIKPAD